MLVVAPLMHGNAQWVMWNAIHDGRHRRALHRITATTPTTCGD